METRITMIYGKYDFTKHERINQEILSQITQIYTEILLKIYLCGL